MARDHGAHETLDLTRDDAVQPGRVVALRPGLRRVVAGNGGPFTYTGTCTYLLGQGRVAVIDPGPDDPAHRAALLSGLAGETVSHIVVTHTHRDHSPGAAPLAALTGAPIVGCGPHRRSRDLAAGERDTMEGSGDGAYRPDRVLADGDGLNGDGWTLRAVATPGHTANHLAFLWREARALFSGDHVMAWSTTIVAPPDGAMGDYMRSLERLRGLPADIYWPGHGGPVTDPERFVRALLNHRRQRETAILARLDPDGVAIPDIVAALYAGLAPALTGAAALSVFAHLEDLVGRGLATSDGAPRVDGRFAKPV